MTTPPVHRTLDWATVAELEKACDIDTLANALRNIITLTDDATHAAQAASRARQEYVPTVVFKDGIYRAMDTALAGERYDVRGGNLATFFDEDSYEPTTNDNKALARAIQFANEMWDQAVDNGDVDSITTDYSSWIADFVQNNLDSDAKARAKPVEVRGPELCHCPGVADRTIGHAGACW